MLFTEFSHEQQNLMIEIAQDSIASKLKLQPRYRSADYDSISTLDWLEKPAATFVTLSINGALRGCIGTLEARRSLLQDLQSNAVNAAFYDSRFEPVSVSEFESLSIHISVLTAPVKLDVSNEKELLSSLRLGIDGLIIEEGGHRATFLPQVWHQLPTAKKFIERLKLKAGLPSGYWSDRIHFYTYQVIDVVDHNVEKHSRNY
ncbi:AmmeMemoRadiSam system protein A [Neptuniibacter sp. SY11_33]|uniref:AmmeMemoRadiSam system protein A n=1 Tax=Neptuniibacter sp. SY11_33 TaxID=3398215 RepID=UPI0039F644D5